MRVAAAEADTRTLAPLLRYRSSGPPRSCRSIGVLSRRQHGRGLVVAPSADSRNRPGVCDDADGGFPAALRTLACGSLLDSAAAGIRSVRSHIWLTREPLSL